MRAPPPPRARDGTTAPRQLDQVVAEPRHGRRAIPDRRRRSWSAPGSIGRAVDPRAGGQARRRRSGEPARGRPLEVRVGGCPCVRRTGHELSRAQLRLLEDRRRARLPEQALEVLARLADREDALVRGVEGLLECPHVVLGLEPAAERDVQLPHLGPVARLDEELLARRRSPAAPSGSRGTRRPVPRRPRAPR